MIIILHESVAVPLTHPRVLYKRVTGTVSVTSNGTGSQQGGPLIASTVNWWRPSELPASWTVTTGSAVAADSFGIVGIYAGVNVTLEYHDGDDWVELADVNPADNRPIAALFDEVFASQWRVTFSGSGDPRLYDVTIGKQLAFPRPVYGGINPPNLSRETTLYNNVSRGGQMFRQKIRRRGVSSSINIRHMKASFVRDEMDDFIRASRSLPYWLLWRPETFPDEIVYVANDGDIQPSNMGIRDLMEAGWSFSGVGFD